MAQGLTEAVMRRPPRASNASPAEVGMNFQTVLINGSVTNVVVLPSGAPVSGGCWVSFKPSIDCRIRFGLAGIGAAIAGDTLLVAGQTEEFWIAYPDDANFSVFAAAAGLLDRWRSSR